LSSLKVMQTVSLFSSCGVMIFIKNLSSLEGTKSSPPPPPQSVIITSL
jgi:hypothetical protein